MSPPVATGAYGHMHALDGGRWRNYRTGWKVLGDGACVRCGRNLPLGATVTRDQTAGRHGYACPTCIPCHPAPLVLNRWGLDPEGIRKYWADRFHADCALCAAERERYEAYRERVGRSRERCPCCNGTGYRDGTAPEDEE